MVLPLRAQFSSATIGINGLTCSACAKGVELRVRKLPFVDSVAMNLKQTEAKIFFKKNTKIEIAKLAKAVVDAGFSVRSLQIGFKFNKVDITDNYCFTFEGNNYQFLKTGNKNLNGNVVLKLVGQDYLTKTDLASWKPLLKNVCGTTDKKVKTYFVTL